MANAYLIDPETQRIEPVEVAGREAIAELIGFDTLTSDRLPDGGDYLFFDEECFIRGTTGRFKLGNMVPVAGKAVVVGYAEHDAGVSDVVMGLEELKAQVAFQ
jgi:hypothetical protein